MISVRDVRIGNYVMTLEGSLEIVIGFFGMGTIQTRPLVRKPGGRLCYMRGADQVLGVEITREILTACKFKKTGYSRWSTNSYDHTGYEFIYGEGSTGCVILNTSGKQGEGEIFFHGISYLHELQNLWYALCKKELEIKIPSTDEGKIKA